VELTKKITSVLLGVAIGDALGVPVEFMQRAELRKNPVKEMTGFGSHNQPPGTFSDDSSLTFCLAEVLTRDFDLKTIGRNFIKWAYGNYWTAHGHVFDIGFTTKYAIEKIAKGTPVALAGGTDENSNGNGALMRIAPLLFYLKDKPMEERFLITHQVAAITHGHIRSTVACFYYLEFARKILTGEAMLAAYRHLQESIPDFLRNQSVPVTEIHLFHRLLANDIWELDENAIQSGGYVLHTLEAAMWCLFTSTSFEATVLKAVNLGGDTDTTAAVTGGIAGLVYGTETIPSAWLKQLAGHDDIIDLAQRMGEKPGG
jgi:ADP-ribosylglycohydrolase